MAEARQRKFWGWGYEDEGPTAEQQEKIAALLARALRHRAADVAGAAAPRRDRAAPRRASRRRPRWRRSAPTRPASAPAHTYGKSFRDVVRAFARDFANPPDLVAFPRDEADVVALLDWCTRRARRRDPVRRRLERRRRRRAAARRRLPRRVSHRPAPPRPRARDRPRLARGAHPGRRARAGARGPAAAARLHAAPLPAVVRVLVARRLDRDPLGRPLRHALHAHRRLRRIAARGHAERRRSSRAACRAPAPARAPTACSSAPRASSASSPRPGCGCRIGRRSAPRRRSRFTDFLAGARRGARDQPGRALSRPTAACSIAGEALTRRRRQRQRGGAAARLRVGRSSARRLDGARPRVLRATTAAASPDGAGTTRTRADGAPRRRRRRLAAGVPRRAVPARRAGRHGHDQRDLRDRDHLGPLRGLPRRASWRRPQDAVRRVCGAGHGHLPLHARLPRRPGAVLHASSRRAAAGSQLAQWAEIKAAASRRRSSRTAARSPTTTPSAATTARGTTASGPDGFAAALRAAKRALDPAGILNPGVLIDA